MVITAARPRHLQADGISAGARICMLWILARARAAVAECPLTAGDAPGRVIGELHVERCSAARRRASQNSATGLGSGDVTWM